MSRILSIAHTPPTTVERNATVADAVALMIKNRVGATAVVKDGKLCGIFTERDLMTKVVGQNKDAAATPIVEVMTEEVQPLPTSQSPGRALRIMTERHFRHMPVCDAEGTVLGILSVRDVLQHSVNKALSELDSLEAFLMADGPGG